MRTRLRLAAMVFAVLSMVGVGVAALPSVAAAAPAINCIQNPTHNSNNTAHFTGTNVNIRTGPSTSCTAVGEGQPSHRVVAHCINSALTWVYLWDLTTGKKGWSSSAFVTWSGGLIFC